VFHVTFPVFRDSVTRSGSNVVLSANSPSCSAISFSSLLRVQAALCTPHHAIVSSLEALELKHCKSGEPEVNSVCSGQALPAEVSREARIEWRDGNAARHIRSEGLRSPLGHWPLDFPSWSTDTEPRPRPRPASRQKCARGRRRNGIGTLVSIGPQRRGRNQAMPSVRILRR
jgi:hypothetical protein